MLPNDASFASIEMLQLVETKFNAGFWFWNCKTRSLHWSAGLYRLLGLEPNGVTPSYALVNERTHPADRLPPGEFERLLSEGTFPTREYRVIWPDGRVRWLHSQVEFFHDEYGKSARLVGLAIDVTDKHEARQRRDVFASRLQALTSISEAIIFISLPNGEMVSAANIDPVIASNPSKYHGYNWHQFVHPDDLPHTIEAIERTAATQEAFDVEHRAQMPDGSYRWRRTRAKRISNGDGTVREYIGVSTDIHGRKLRQIEKNAELPLTGAQIRAARSIVNWSVKDLAEAADVSPSTIRRLEETQDVMTPIEPTLPALRNALENAGVDFLISAKGKPGVRPK